jgi:hypothetical protein
MRAADRIHAYRWEPSCACGWVGRARMDKVAAQRAAAGHERRCGDSDPHTRVEWRSLASIHREN